MDGRICLRVFFLPRARTSVIGEEPNDVRCVPGLQMARLRCLGMTGTPSTVPLPRYGSLRASPTNYITAE